MLSILAAAEKSGFPPWTFGAFFLGTSLALAAQTWFTVSRGFVFRENMVRVYRNTELARYRFWLGVQLILILITVAFSISGFWVVTNAPHP